MTYLILFLLGIIFATFFNPIITGLSELILSVIDLGLNKLEANKVFYAQTVNNVNIEMQQAVEKIGETPQPQIGFILPEDCIEEEPENE